MSITNFSIFRKCFLGFWVVLLVLFVFNISFIYDNLYVFFLCVSIAVLISLLFLCKKNNEIVIREDGIYIYNRAFLKSFFKSQKITYISFIYLTEFEIKYGYPIVLHLKYFKSNGDFYVKKFIFFVTHKNAIEFENILHQKIWGVKY